MSTFIDVCHIRGTACECPLPDSLLATDMRPLLAEYCLHDRRLNTTRSGHPWPYLFGGVA